MGGNKRTRERVMLPYAKPSVRPAMPYFSSGPTKKRPGWSSTLLDDACTSRSHRSKPAKQKINHAMTLARDILGLPDSYRIGVVPGSDTGAVEMAMWSMLGARGAEILAWESFGKDWLNDAVNQLKIDSVTHVAPYGQLPNLGAIDFNNDIVFTWNGTASGVKVPDGGWIPDDRAGLTIADATSACFAMDLPWHKLDVVTFSFQKSLGGEGGHGVLILPVLMVVQKLSIHILDNIQIKCQLLIMLHHLVLIVLHVVVVGMLIFGNNLELKVVLGIMHISKLKGLMVG